MTDLETRSIDLRADTETGTVEGIAVPYGQTVGVGGYKERFERGAITDSGSIKFFSQHREIVGRVIETEDREEGFWIKAKVSDTSAGRDLLALMRDGAIDKFSVGFVPTEHREEKGGVIVRTRVDLREVSAVTFPAYSGAAITNVREDTTQEVATVENTTPTAADLAEVRGAVEDLDRKFGTLSTRLPEPQAAANDTRTAGEIVKALARGDEATVKAVSDIQERAYTGGTTAASVIKDGWVGDLTRLFDNSSGVLSAVFETGALPADGMNIEYAQLKSNTVQVTQQAAEGDDLAYGKVELENKTAPVLTYGGYVQLSRQQIERSTLPVLNLSLDALAMAAGKRAKLELRTQYNTLKTAREAISSNGGVVVLGATLASSTYLNWVAAIVEAVGRFDDNALSIDTLILSKSVFLKLASLVDSAGRPLVSLDGSGNNTVGRINVTALNGSLAGVPFVLDPGLTGDSAAFANGRAIRVYQSGLVSLQDENIINLSKDFSIYRYAAIATEIPAGLVPVKLAAS